MKGLKNMQITVKKSFIVSAIIAIMVVITAIASIAVVPTGYTGVKVTFQQISEKPLVNGFNFKIPFVQRVVKINNKQQQFDINDTEIWGETKSRTAIYFQNINITYKINPEYSAWIYANINDYKDYLITAELIGSALKSASKTLNDTDVSNRDMIEKVAKDKLQASLNDKYGNEVVTITKVIVGNVDFEEDYNTALAEKQKEQLAYEKQAIANKKNIEKAEADAEALKRAAEGKAEAAIIEAEGKRKAYEELNAALSDKVIKQNAVEKWDGKLPEVLGNEDILISKGS